MSRLDTNLVLTDRDILILKEVSKWKFLLSRQIRIIGGFGGQRACDQRLAKLIKFGYLERNRPLVGIPSLYALGKNAKDLSEIQYQSKKIKFNEVNHDIAVVDTVIFLMDLYDLKIEDFISERQLHSYDGFGTRHHHPDAVFLKDGGKICVEVEFTVKAKDLLSKNMKSNFSEYTSQLWVIPENHKKLMSLFDDLFYPNMHRLTWEVIKEYVEKKE